MITFPLDALEAMDLLAGLKRAKHIAADTSFFKSGLCVRRMFVCVVKTSLLSMYDQDIRADQPEHTRTQQAYVPQTPGRRQRHATDIQGILHPRAVELDTLLAHEVLCSVCEWIRDY